MGKNLIHLNLLDEINDFCRKREDFTYETRGEKVILRRKDLTNFKFPSEVRIRPEALGLLIGEGYIDEKQVVFGISNPKAVKIILKFFKKFKINPDFQLEISTKNVGPSFIQKSKSFWEKEFGINLEKVKKRSEFNNTTNYGTLHLRYCNSCFCRVLKKILKKSKEKVERNKKLSKGYMKGILAAEGNVAIKNDTKCLYMIRISAKEKDTRLHYKKCLNKLGFEIYCKDMKTIEPGSNKTQNWKTDHGRGGCVIISRWENFLRILELNLLELSNKKDKKFIKGFLENLYTKKYLIDFKAFIGKVFTLKQMKKCFGMTRKPICRTRSMIEKGFIKRDESKMPYKHWLTRRYKEIYEKLRSKEKNYL